MIIDTHCHLYYPELISQIDEIVSRAIDAGIVKMIVPAVDYETSLTALELSEKYEMIYCALGVHPGDVNKNEIKVIDKIEKLLTHEKVVAIGETGLDYYWDTSNIEKQKEFFQIQIELAKSNNLPVIIHTRSSVNDAVTMIENSYDKNLSGQFHCFSGNDEELKRILQLHNFKISFCGNITYKNYSDSDIDIIRNCPVERILSETDSPFLPPVPFRGKKNEPAFIVNTLTKIAVIKNLDYINLTSKLFLNARDLFLKLKFET